MGLIAIGCLDFKLKSSVFWFFPHCPPQKVEHVWQRGRCNQVDTPLARIASNLSFLKRSAATKARLLAAEYPQGHFAFGWHRVPCWGPFKTHKTWGTLKKDRPILRYPFCFLHPFLAQKRGTLKMGTLKTDQCCCLLENKVVAESTARSVTAHQNTA